MVTAAMLEGITLPPLFFSGILTSQIVPLPEKLTILSINTCFETKITEPPNVEQSLLLSTGV